MYVPFIMSEDLDLGKIGHLLANPADPEPKMCTKEYINRDD